MRIVVTGGAGFIGSHLCEELLKRENEVICVDNLYTGSIKNMSSIMENENFSFYESDITNYEKLKDIFKTETIDMVYHLASVVGVIRTLENPEKVFDVNINGTENILSLATEYGCSKVVNVSSSEVYGDPIEIPEKEDSPKNVNTPYATSKLICEQYAQMYNDIHGLKTTSLRLFNAYGPKQDSTPYGFVVGIFINNILGGKSPIIFGDGFQTRDFTYINDIINPMIISGETSRSNGESINIAAGKPTTLIDLAEMIMDLCGKKIEPVFVEERPFEIRHRFSDVSKMRTILGYKPKVELKEGLQSTINWYKNELLSEIDESCCSY